MPAHAAPPSKAPITITAIKSKDVGSVHASRVRALASLAFGAAASVRDVWGLRPRACAGL